MFSEMFLCRIYCKVVYISILFGGYIMAQFLPIMKDIRFFLYGGDYCPEQWIEEKETVYSIHQYVSFP